MNTVAPLAEKPSSVSVWLFLSWLWLKHVFNHLLVLVGVFKDEVDSQNPVLRDNHQLHEEVKGWLKDQKVQEIFMQGKSLFGLCGRILACRLILLKLTTSVTSLL